MGHFGTLNFSVSFKPTGAFPINANQYFESLEDAQAAAATAEEVGSKNTIYYYGMKLLVDNGSTAKWYTIQRDGTLLEDGVGTDSSDGTSFTVDETLTFQDGILGVNPDFIKAISEQVKQEAYDAIYCVPVDLEWTLASDERSIYTDFISNTSLRIKFPSDYIGLKIEYYHIDSAGGYSELHTENVDASPVNVASVVSDWIFVEPVTHVKLIGFLKDGSSFEAADVISDNYKITTLPGFSGSSGDSGDAPDTPAEATSASLGTGTLGNMVLGT